MSSKFVRNLAAAAALFALASVPAQAQNASVRVVHGIPGADVSPAIDPATPVDVQVNGAICLLQGFTFGEISGPYTLPAGSYTVAISLANSLEPCSGDAVRTMSSRVATPSPMSCSRSCSPF